MVSEYFNQSEKAGKVDILIIDDNSVSMEQEQRKMARRFDSFISQLKDVDYQIAITTTDLSSEPSAARGSILTYEGSRTKILTPKTPNANTLFLNTIQRKETIGCSSRSEPPFCPSGDEQPLKAIMTAIDKRASANQGFFRDGVDLVAVVLSDEDEMSSGPPKATKPLEVIRHFETTFGTTKKFAVHGIIIPPGDAACKKEQGSQLSDGTSVSYGTHVAELAARTGGTIYSICSEDYGSHLAKISRRVRDLISTFELQQAAKPGTVRVGLTPAASIGFKVNGKQLIFDTPPPAGTRIDVSYEPL